MFWARHMGTAILLLTRKSGPVTDGVSRGIVSSCSGSSPAEPEGSWSLTGGEPSWRDAFLWLALQVEGDVNAPETFVLRLREGHMLGCSTLSFESPATNSDTILLQWHHFKFVGLVCTILNPLNASSVAVISLLLQQCSLLSVCSPICNDKYFPFFFAGQVTKP